MATKAKKATRKKTAKKSTRKTTSRRTSVKRAAERRQQPESLRLRSATPSLTVNDVAESLAWYRDVLGFTVKDRWDHEGKLAGAELAAGSVFLMLSQDDWKKGRERAKGEGFRLYCSTTQDVDRLAEAIKTRGGKLLQEPTDQAWGMRDFAVADPDGFKISIGNDK